MDALTDALFSMQDWFIARQMSRYETSFHDAEDDLSQAYTELFPKRDSIKSAPALLFYVADKRTIDRIVRRENWRCAWQVLSDFSEAIEDPHLLNVDVEDAAEAFLSTLDLSDQQILSWQRDGQTHGEIALQLGVSRPCICQRVTGLLAEFSLAT